MTKARKRDVDGEWTLAFEYREREAHAEIHKGMKRKLGAEEYCDELLGHVTDSNHLEPCLAA